MTHLSHTPNARRKRVKRLLAKEKEEIRLSFERAMSNRPNPRHPMFAAHNCWKCREGERPCVVGNPHRCEYPHARND